MNTKTHRIPVITLTLTSLLGLGAAAGAVSCAQAAEAPSITVSYQDLDLARTADARVLYARLRRAADAVCDNSSRFDLSRRVAYERCYNAALADAVRQVNAPQVLALHQAATTSQRG